MTFPIAQIRERFPALSVTDEHRSRIYLDNPAGTQVPKQVIDEIARCLTYTTANLGGKFRTSRAADDIYVSGHRAMADFLGTNDPGEISIGASMTALTFHMSRSICRNFAHGDEIIVTRMDHEGNVSPWLEIAKDRGLVIRWAEFDRETWTINPESVRQLTNERTRLIALNYASNMTGAINDVEIIATETRQSGVLVYIDAVQLAPHLLIDVDTTNCDFLVCSPYKFYGPHLGVLWGRREILETLHAYKCRCSDNNLPGRFEIGTPAIELLAGLSACINHHAWLGEALGAKGDRRSKIAEAFEASARYESTLVHALLEGLTAIPGVEIIGPIPGLSTTARVPTVSFRHRDVTPAAIALSLAADNIFAWHGHNYAFEMARVLGFEQHGGVRVGIAHYNTIEEVRRTIEAVTSAVSGP